MAVSKTPDSGRIAAALEGRVSLDELTLAERRRRGVDLDENGRLPWENVRL